MKYPADIVNEDVGWHRIHKGHNLDRGMLLADIEHNGGEMQGIGEELIVEEHYFRWVPRVKWCKNLDGWGCDNEGDWHSHWTEVKPNPERAFTIVYWGKP